MSSTNPFLVNRAQLITAFYPDEPASYTTNLKVLSLLYGLAFLLIVVGVAGRVYRKTCSFYRKEVTLHGTYLVLDTPLVGGALQALFVLGAQVYIWEHILVIKEHASQLHAVVLQGLMWAPLWLNGVVLVRGVVTNSLLQKYRYADSKSVPWFATSKGLNIMFTVAPLLLLIPVMIIFVVASQRANQSFLTFADLTVKLLSAAEEFNGVVNQTTSRNFIQAELKLATETVRWKKLQQIGFSLWFTGAVTLLLLFIPFTLMHLKQIQVQVSKLSSTSTPTTLTKPTGILVPLAHIRNVSDSTLESGDWKWIANESGQLEQKKGHHYSNSSLSTRSDSISHAGTCETETDRGQKALRAVYRNIVLQLLAFTLLILSYAIFGIVTAVTNAIGIDGVRARRREVLWSLYIYACFGLVAQIFVIIRSFDRPSPLTKSTLSENLEAAVGLGRREQQRRRHGMMKPLVVVDCGETFENYERQPAPPQAAGQGFSFPGPTTHRGF